jgi:hypothetical protein
LRRRGLGGGKTIKLAEALIGAVENMGEAKRPEPAIDQARSTASVALVAPNRVPAQKPARRPNRPMNSEAGIVVSMVPIIRNEIGRVASDLSVASMWPARPPEVMIITMPVCSSA